MRLLICTQAVDLDNPVLGFFHGWIAELASRFDEIVVICLYEGRHALPKNVRVYSLGKEKGAVSATRYALRFLGLVLKHRTEYDTVFVHMNQEYVLLGGIFWKFWGKHIYLWRNHYSGTFLTDIAATFCKKIFYTSKHSYTAKYHNARQMPIGIDLSLFKPAVTGARISNSVLSLGRISPSKRLEVFLDALKILSAHGLSYSADVYGDALPADGAYLSGLKDQVRDSRLEAQITFHLGIPNAQTPAVYASHEIFVNMSGGGMYDKTIFEAAACGCLVLASSPDFSEWAGKELTFESNAESLATRLQAVLSASLAERSDMQARLVRGAEKNSLKAFSSALSSELER
jgi:glycosyltransferase involved in cell wall biosynthesis